jgi:Tol biopolymer transport system component
LESALTWYDRSGKRGQTVAIADFGGATRLSPNGQLVVAPQIDPANRKLELWLYDLKRGVSSRFTFDPADDDDPVWSPDGKMLVFDSQRSGNWDIYWKPVDGSRKEGVLFRDEGTKFPTSWSADGQYLAFDRQEKGQSRFDVWVLPMTGERKPFAFLASEFDERQGEFSPDGKWMAFRTDASGQFEVYVTDFPGAGSRFQISSGSGTCPKWRADGRELFYIDYQGRITAVEIESRGNTLTVGGKRVLATVQPRSYDAAFIVARDGRNFLVNELRSANVSQLVLVTDWDVAVGKK